MPFKIAKKLRPFCHLPGTCCLIPFSQWQVEVFPSLLKFKNLVSGAFQEMPIHFIGPLLDFTVELDLEGGCIRVFGHTQAGYRRYQIFMKKEGICLHFDKEKREVVIPAEFVEIEASQERLSLGREKQLDWELVKRRKDMREILPLLFRLGQIVPRMERMSMPPPASKLEIEDYFLKLFLVGFKGMLMPSLIDIEHQGISLSLHTFFHSPFQLVHETKNQIRALFFQEEENSFSFLPLLAPSFHEGRMMDIKTSQGDTISFEWSKKLLRQVVIDPGKKRTVELKVQKELKSYRLRYQLKERGRRKSVHDALLWEEGKTLYLDCFEK